MIMECNKDEAMRAKNIAEKKMQVKDFAGARRLVQKAQHLESNLTNLSQMLLVCEVHCASETKLPGNEMDWYAILQVEHTADESTIKKQYRKLALQLHPDKNSFPGAEAAFKLIGEAQTLLLDTQKRYVHDVKRNAYLQGAKRPAVFQQKPASQTNSYAASANGYNSSNYAKVNFEKQYNSDNGFARATFWTTCPFCSVKFQYAIETINKLVVCQSCKKTFIASEASQRSSPPIQRAAPASPNPKDESFPAKVEKPKREKERKKRRHHESSSSESFDDDKSETDEEDGEFKAEFNVEASSEPPRRSGRNKQNVSYKEAQSDEEEEEDDSTISFPEAEFKNFNKLREQKAFSLGQIWALYDSHDGMPRLYARIHRIFSKSFKLQIKWLEAENRDDDDVANACGVYINSQTEETDELTMFSHEMKWELWSRNKYKILPKRGEIWGLHKGNIVEIVSDMSEGGYIEGAYLEKIDGFVSLYRRSGKQVRLLENEMDRFSHRIPAFVMSGKEKLGVPKGSFELDPAALPSS